jgi:hypothetical protein
MGKCENHMVIGNRQQLLQAIIHPFDLPGELALGTVAVAARVIGVLDITAHIVRTFLDVSTHDAGAAIPDGPHNGAL